MNDYIKKYGRSSLIVSTLLCAVAIFLIVSPEVFISVIMTVLGIALAALGVFHVVSYFRTDSTFRSFSMELLEGIAMLVIGAIFIVKPSVITNILLQISGIWVIVESLIRLQLAFNVKKELEKRFIIVFIFAALTLIMGIVMVFNPFGTALAITSAVGAMLLLNEIVNVIEAIMILSIKE